MNKTDRKIVDAIDHELFKINHDVVKMMFTKDISVDGIEALRNVSLMLENRRKALHTVPF